MRKRSKVGYSKSAKILAVLFITVLVFSGCQKPQTEEKSPQETQVAETQNDFYNSIVNSNERPIAVMIDNDSKASWPHAGLTEAYLMYEVMVEGGATRIMALFKNASPSKIGPVRSSRHYFLDYVLENDAIYVHAGWSPKAETDIPQLGINNINGILGTDSKPFWREEKFKGDYHSLFTSMPNLKDMVTEKQYRTTTEQKNLNFVKNEINLTSGEPANRITIPYTEGFYRVDYLYNSTTKTFDRSMNQSPHILQNDQTVSTKNVIIQFAKNYPLGDGTARQNVDTMSGGKGYYFTDGSYIEITWSKPTRESRTVYKDADGKEIMINPGQTIIQIVPPTAKVVIE